jgi:hypothetical protein
MLETKLAAGSDCVNTVRGLAPGTDCCSTPPASTQRPIPPRVTPALTSREAKSMPSEDLYCPP